MKEKQGLALKMADLFKMPNKEELKQIAKKNYEDNRLNPNNFSFWFKPLSEALATHFKVPASVVMEIPFELREDIRQDIRTITPEIIAAFEKFVFDNEEIKKLNKSTKKFFIKSGVFSNKFDFNEACNLTDWANLFKQVYNIEYMAMTYGANHTNELVVREFISDVEDRKTIYNGMPLRTEFRVFYDFELDGVIGISNYWHPEEMVKALMPYSVRKVFADIPNLEEQRKLSKQIIAKLKNEFDTRALEEYFNYMDSMKLIQADYEKLRVQVAADVQDALQGKECMLTGRWSIDIMKNGEEFYFIDAAIMEQSALVNRMEEIRFF